MWRPDALEGLERDSARVQSWTVLGCPELDGSWVSRALAALKINQFID